MKHLKDHGMTYNEHRRFAWSYSYKCLKASLAAFIHGLLPCILTTTASDIIKRLK